jgi:AraC family transcriptional regulator
MQSSVRTIPELLCAVFRHQGPLSYLPETLKYVWGSWLPKSDFEHLETPEFELYSPGTQPDDPDKVLFLHIPVVAKA